MARVDGGELLTRTLARHGVREVFTLHGGHLDAAYQAESARRLRFIDTRHEQAAGHAADGWARTTGRVGVAMVTAGPGVTDVVTAVANACLDCIPTLFIGGAAPLRDAETLPLQGGFDQLALMPPITKWAHRITQTARIPDLVTQALRVATTGRPGPVFLEIPIDVLFARVDEERATVPAYLRPEAGPAPAPARGASSRWTSPARRSGGTGMWISASSPTAARRSARWRARPRDDAGPTAAPGRRRCAPPARSRGSSSAPRSPPTRRRRSIPSASRTRSRPRPGRRRSSSPTAARRRRGWRWRRASARAGGGSRTATSAASAPACRSPSRPRWRTPTGRWCAWSATARLGSTSPSSTPWCATASRSSRW